MMFGYLICRSRYTGDNLIGVASRKSSFWGGVLGFFIEDVEAWERTDFWCTGEVGFKLRSPSAKLLCFSLSLFGDKLTLEFSES